ncbi:MAG: hypothetical protein SFZ23_01025 [Planctomycetota bacterium]|nr:hypothetical protein [Planctomycetota bacterium]
MKALIAAFSIFAIANVLGAAGLVGWLHSSGRLNSERVQKIREMLKEPIEAEKARLARDAAALEAKKKADEEEAKRNLPPLTGEQQLVLRLLATEADQQRRDRLAREIADLQEGLRRELAALETARASLKSERDAFNELQKQTQQLTGDAQFRKAVGILESMKAPEAMATLRQLLESNASGLAFASPTGSTAPAGSPPAGALGANTPLSVTSPAQPAPAVDAKRAAMERVVTYLNAMQERPRNKLMAEFVRADPALAGQLLERLRTHGTLVAAAGGGTP